MTALVARPSRRRPRTPVPPGRWPAPRRGRPSPGRERRPGAEPPLAGQSPRSASAPTSAAAATTPIEAGSGPYPANFRTPSKIPTRSTRNLEILRSCSLRPLGRPELAGSPSVGGGLPPDVVVEDIDEILTATAEAVDAYHDPSPSSMLRIAVAPCSPFSASAELMTGSAALARSKGVRLHTHLAETLDEDEHCLEQFGLRPADYLEKLGWLGPDVWLAHTVHLSDADIGLLAATGTGSAHCPSSNGRLGVRDQEAGGSNPLAPTNSSHSNQNSLAHPSHWHR